MRPPRRLAADMYREGEIARHEPLWAPTGEGAGGSKPPPSGTTSKAPSGVAGALPHLVIRLARACNEPENDAPRSVLARLRRGRLKHEFPPEVERELGRCLRRASDG